MTLCDLIGRPELAADPRFAERETRKKNRAALKALIEEALSTAPGGGLGGDAEPRRRAGRARADHSAGARGAAGAASAGDGALFDGVAGRDRPLTVVRGGFLVDGERAAAEGAAARSSASIWTRYSRRCRRAAGKAAP